MLRLRKNQGLMPVLSTGSNAENYEEIEVTKDQVKIDIEVQIRVVMSESKRFTMKMRR